MNFSIFKNVKIWIFENLNWGTWGKARTKTLVLLAEFPPEILKSFFSSEPKNSIKLESALLEHSWRNFNLRTFDYIEVLRLKRNSRSISRLAVQTFSNVVVVVSSSFFTAGRVSNALHWNYRCCNIVISGKTLIN